MSKSRVFKWLSPILVLAVLLSMGVMAAVPVGATVSAVTVTATPATASEVAGYTFNFTTTVDVPVGNTVTITFPSTATVPVTIAESFVTVNGTQLSLAAGDRVTVSGQSVTLTLHAALTAGSGRVVTINQGAGIKNPAIAKTVASGAYPVTVMTSEEALGTGYLGIIPSYTISPISGNRATAVTVTGKGWTPNSSIAISGNLTGNGVSQTDGTFTLTASPVSSGNVYCADGAGQTQAGGTVTWDSAVTVPTFTLGATVSVTPTSGDIGTTVTVKGYDFTSGSNIPSLSITMGGMGLAPAASSNLTTRDAYGSLDDFSIPLVIPANMPGGAKTVSVTDNASKIGTTTFTVNTPTITMSPASGAPNTLVTISGSHFQASDTIIAGNLTFAGNTWNTAALTVDASGNWNVNLRVPAAAVAGNNPVRVTTSAGTVVNSVFAVGARVVTITPASGPIGTTVLVSATNMTPGSTIAVGALTFNGAAWNTAAITIDSLGNMASTTLVVPTAVAGSRTVTATDGALVTAVGVFTVTQPTISISPTTGYMGNTITVTGSGWVPGMMGMVTIRFTDTAARTMVLATPDASGTITGVFTVPVTASTTTNSVTALDSLGNASPAVAFALAPAAITLSPTSGPVGTVVTVSGAGFPPLTGLTAGTGLIIGGVPVLPATAVMTNSTGAFSTTFTVPGLATGAQSVTATAGATTSVNVFFTITAAAETVQTQLSGISTHLIRVWGLSGGVWKMYDPADPVGSDLASLVAGKGYFVNVDAACTLIYGGFTYTLDAGWNLIGWR